MKKRNTYSKSKKISKKKVLSHEEKLIENIKEVMILTK